MPRWPSLEMPRSSRVGAVRPVGVSIAELAYEYADYALLSRIGHYRTATAIAYHQYESNLLTGRCSLCDEPSYDQMHGRKPADQHNNPVTISSPSRDQIVTLPLLTSTRVCAMSEVGSTGV